MTVEQYGVAIRAAYEHGYLDGLYHPRERRVMERAKECSDGFWTYVLAGLRERMRPGRALAIAVDFSRSSPDALTTHSAEPR